MTTRDHERSAGPTAAQRERLAAFRAATTLSDLVALTDADTEHEAYVAAKREWRDLRGAELAAEPRQSGLPGTRVDVASVPMHVHGVTHADTPEERDYLREHVTAFLDDGAAVYCEQGIRHMYFADLEAVCAMDDYRWAMARCRELEVDSHVDEDTFEAAFDGVAEELDSLSSQFQDAVFSLIHAVGERYGEEVRTALGDLASSFLTSHEDLATGEDFASYRLRRRAARNPAALVDLQHYYERQFLPQPLEREWLRRHDRELEVVTHGRNERMAGYAVYHNDAAPAVHLVVGAAHQPGVTYYLERHRDGDRDVAGFEPVA